MYTCFLIAVLLGFFVPSAVAMRPRLPLKGMARPPFASVNVIVRGDVPIECVQKKVSELKQIVKDLMQLNGELCMEEECFATNIRRTQAMQSGDAEPDKALSFSITYASTHAEDDW